MKRERERWFCCSGMCSSGRLTDTWLVLEKGQSVGKMNDTYNDQITGLDMSSSWLIRFESQCTHGMQRKS